MLNSNIDLSFGIKENIRQIEFNDLKIGGDTSFAFLKENNNKSKPIIAIEIPFIYDGTYPEIIKNNWKADNFIERFEKALKTNADIISIKFNVSDANIKEEIPNIKNFLANLPPQTKPLILRGANNTKTDRELLPILATYAPKESIIAFADEDSYEDIVPTIIKHNHILVLRTPIDINLAKELNVLASDKGLPLNRILIDPDMGGLGYGLEYGYSIIEKIKLAGFEGDKMLNLPIIAFIGEESYRAKEAKSDTFSDNWGDFTTRATMWEISGASTMIAAGANIVVVWNPDSIDILKGII